METPLWKINKEKLNKTNLALYSDFIKKNYKISSGDNFDKIWKWSVDNPKDFWKSIWQFTKVKGDLGKIILRESNIFFKNKFFPDSYLNYAENLLKKNNEDSAIIFKSENGYKKTITWKNLNKKVKLISEWMKSNGIKKSSYSADLGYGLRAITGDIVAYSHSNEISNSSLKKSSENLCSTLSKSNFPPYRSKQIKNWARKSDVKTFEQMSNMPKEII